MVESIKMWIPIDTDINAPNYQIPNFENQKDLFVATLTPNEDAPVEEDDGGDPFYEYTEQDEEGGDIEMNELHSDWIKVISYSQDTAKGEGRKNERNEPYIGELTFTKFTCDRSPSLNYSSLRGELIPHIIMRVFGKLKDNELPIIEYELQYCSLVDVSISGGTGGKPVETLSISSKILIIKNIKLNVVTGELTCYQVCKWDKIKGTGSKTIRQLSNGTTNTGSLFELAKQCLMVDLDSHDPSMVKLLKELGIVSEYELPESEYSDPAEGIYTVMTNKDPALFQLIDVPSSGVLTIEIVKKAISDKLNIPLDTIKSLYSYTNGILIDSQKVLNLSNAFIVQTTDGKFYGH